MIIFMTGVLWRESRPLARRLVRWLLTEHSAGHDDRWGTLLGRACSLLDAAPRIEAGPEQELVRALIQVQAASWPEVFVPANVCAFAVQNHCVSLMLAFAVFARQPSERPPLVLMHWVNLERQLMKLDKGLSEDVPPEEFFEPILGALEGGDPKSRCAAAQALAWLGAEWSVGPLISALQDPDDRVKKSAVVALGRIGSSRAVDSLVPLFAHDWKFREELIQSLSNLASERLESAMAEAMRSCLEFIRTEREAFGVTRNIHTPEEVRLKDAAQILCNRSRFLGIVV